MRFLKAILGDEKFAGHATRRSAGAWQRRRLFTIWILVIIFNAGLLGVIVGNLLVQASSPTLTIWIALVLFIGSCVVNWWVSQRMNYSTSNLEKGLDAEERTGDVIEFALTHKNCAVAHNVTGITNKGDIDHIVVTPQSLWVIDSKFRCDERFLDEQIDRVERQMQAVKRWVADLGFGKTQVKGCLAFLTGFDEEAFERSATGGTSILCVDVSQQDKNALNVALHDDMSLVGSTIDRALVRHVWQLGTEKS